MTDVMSLPRRHLLGAAGASLLMPTALSAQTGRGPFTIYRITYRGRTEVEQGFEDYLAANNVMATFIDRNANRDRSKVPGFVPEIREIKPDLVYTWGTTVTLGIAGPFDAADPSPYIRDIPIVFALVSAPVASRIVPRLETPDRNITGAVHVVPPETQLRAMAAYRPFTRLGVLYTPTEQNSTAIVEQVRALQSAMGFTLIERRFATGADGRPTADGVEQLVAEIKADGADWLYLLPDTFLGTQYDRIVPAAIAEALPTFGAAELAIRRGGALVGLISRYHSVGQLAASKAMRILVGGEDPATIPVETLKRFSLIVNLPVAHTLQLYPPIEMLSYAEVITG